MDYYVNSASSELLHRGSWLIDMEVQNRTVASKPIGRRTVGIMCQATGVEILLEEQLVDEAVEELLESPVYRFALAISRRNG
jgi:hypothetical protein